MTEFIKLEVVRGPSEPDGTVYVDPNQIHYVHDLPNSKRALVYLVGRSEAFAVINASREHLIRVLESKTLESSA